MNKKAIAILGAMFILIVGTLGFLIYSRSNSNNTDNNENPEVVNNPETQPNQNNNSNQPTPTPTQAALGNRFVKLTDDQVVSPALTFDGNGVAYFTKQGLLFRSTFAAGPGAGPLAFSEKKQLAIEPKPGVFRVIWPANTQDFMLEYDSMGKKSYEFYDNAAGTFTKLPTQVYSLSFLPSGDKIYFVWTNQNGHDTVNVADPKTINYRTLGDIWDKNAIVYVSPDGLNVLYHQDITTVSGTANPLVLTDVEGKTWRKLVDGFVSGVLWSPDGKKFLFGKKDPSTQNYNLWYYDLYSGEVKNLGLNTTPEKAIWGSDNRNVYAAVAGSSSSASSFTLDSFYKMDTVSLEKRQFDPTGLQIDARELFLNLDNTKLFFRNAQDGGLYYLDLSQ